MASAQARPRVPHGDLHVFGAVSISQIGHPLIGHSSSDRFLMT